MSITIHRPRGFGGEAFYVPRPRIVAQTMPDAIRLYHAKTDSEVRRCQVSWLKGDYLARPGEIRVMPSMPREQALRIEAIQVDIRHCERRRAAGDQSVKTEVLLRGLLRQREEALASPVESSDHAAPAVAAPA